MKKLQRNKQKQNRFKISCLKKWLTMVIFLPPPDERLAAITTVLPNATVDSHAVEPCFWMSYKMPVIWNPLLASLVQNACLPKLGKSGSRVKLGTSTLTLATSFKNQNIFFSFLLLGRTRYWCYTLNIFVQNIQYIRTKYYRYCKRLVDLNCFKIFIFPNWGKIVPKELKQQWSFSLYLEILSKNISGFLEKVGRPALLKVLYVGCCGRFEVTKTELKWARKWPLYLQRMFSI